MARRPSQDDGPRWPGRTGNRGGYRAGEWLVAIFCLGVIAFSPLVIRMFDRRIRVDVFAIPLLYFYLFSAWALLILLIALVMEGQGEGRKRRASDPQQRLPTRESREP